MFFSWTYGVRKVATVVDERRKRNSTWNSFTSAASDSRNGWGYKLNKRQQCRFEIKFHKILWTIINRVYQTFFFSYSSIERFPNMISHSNFISSSTIFIFLWLWMLHRASAKCLCASAPNHRSSIDCIQRISIERSKNCRRKNRR